MAVTWHSQLTGRKVALNPEPEEAWFLRMDSECGHGSVNASNLTRPRPACSPAHPWFSSPVIPKTPSVATSIRELQILIYQGFATCQALCEALYLRKDGHLSHLRIQELAPQGREFTAETHAPSVSCAPERGPQQGCQGPAHCS